MIYITGDTHGNIDFEKLEKYFNKKNVSREDYLIILGDAGIIWSEKDNFIYKYLCLGLTIFFIDGNHENFNLLNKYQIVAKNNAKCHMIDEYIYHVLRGEILNINNISFLCIGGATSIDKYLRINNISWWADENITDNDINNAIENLKNRNNKVDYVLSHCAPSKIVMKMFGYVSDNDTDKLEKINNFIVFEKWYFGHYHEDKEYNKFKCFYNDIIRIDTTNI